jgi:pyrroline-5-carboxylate reductase
MGFDKRIGIIGVGKMGEALVSGLVMAGLVETTRIFASDLDAERTEHIATRYNIRCCSDNVTLVEKSDIVVLAVQPANVEAVLEDIKDKLTLDHLLVTIVAGVSTAEILLCLQKDIPVIRAMPNNPCMIRKGMVALTTTPFASAEDLENTKKIFQSVGRIVVLDEVHFDAVTGLSGSGPAYVYLFIEALADGGVKAGIPGDISLLLAAQTVLGSAMMVLKTGEHPAILRGMVATPAGTTVSGLMELEEGRMRAAVIKAVEKASQRAAELGRRKSAVHSD